MKSLIYFRAAGGNGGCLDSFSLAYYISSLSPTLGETALYRLKYCLKKLLNPKQLTNQPSNGGLQHVFLEIAGQLSLFSLLL